MPKRPAWVVCLRQACLVAERQLAETVSLNRLKIQCHAGAVARAVRVDRGPQPNRHGSHAFLPMQTCSGSDHACASRPRWTTTAGPDSTSYSIPGGCRKGPGCPRSWTECDRPAPSAATPATIVILVLTESESANDNGNCAHPIPESTADDTSGQGRPSRSCVLQ